MPVSAHIAAEEGNGIVIAWLGDGFASVRMRGRVCVSRVWWVIVGIVRRWRRRVLRGVLGREEACSVKTAGCDTVRN